MAVDLAQEKRWQEEIRATQIKFRKRVDEAMKFSRNSKARKEVYSRWRTEIGDSLAKETAMFVEAYLNGKVKYPTWLSALSY
jgi:hypothetical protein